MAHNFVEHIAGKVVQRIILTNAPMLTRLTSSSRTGLDFTLSWTVRMDVELVQLRDWKDGNGRVIRKFL